MTEKGASQLSIRKVAWVTDIHLEFLRTDQVEAFVNSLCRARPDALLIGGDIGTSRNLVSYLDWIDQKLACPVYFVLGNHDYYHGSISGTRAEVAGWCRGSRRTKWLPEAGVVELSPNTCLIGHGGWGDGRCGDFLRSTVWLNDYALIREFLGFSRKALLPKLNALGDEAAAFLREVLPGVLEGYHEIIFLTHAPPFREACWHEGRLSDSEGTPHFVCAAAGEVLREIMARHPDRSMTVLCGHTHSGGFARILDNLVVKTGAAAYGAPKIQEFLSID
jgi:Icc-related predicted phosphoesterase